MKGIAFFVEGGTEYDFIRQLLKTNYCELGEPKTYKGGVHIFNSIDNKYRVRICNAGSDSKVNKLVNDELWEMNKKGYSMCICLKDLRGENKKHAPRTFLDIVEIKNAENKMLKIFNNDSLSTYSIHAIMEIETWFIAETSHFVRINPNLTQQYIEAKTKDIEGEINPFNCSLKMIEKPAETLNSIYKLAPNAKLKYDKDSRHRNHTIDALDFQSLTQNVAARIEKDLEPELSSKSKLEPYYKDKFGSLRTLVDALDIFFEKKQTK